MSNAVAGEERRFVTVIRLGLARQELDFVELVAFGQQPSR
jgi:hypothetical protein